DSLLQIAVRGGNQTDIDFYPFPSSQPLDFAFFDRASSLSTHFAFGFLPKEDISVLKSGQFCPERGQFCPQDGLLCTCSRPTPAGISASHCFRIPLGLASLLP